MVVLGLNKYCSWKGTLRRIVGHRGAPAARARFGGGVMLTSTTDNRWGARRLICHQRKHCHLFRSVMFPHTGGVCVSVQHNPVQGRLRSDFFCARAMLILWRVTNPTPGSDSLWPSQRAEGCGSSPSHGDGLRYVLNPGETQIVTGGPVSVASKSHQKNHCQR